jgi:glutathione S-transferase
MKLYDCTLAPNPRRVRIFLAEKGVEIEKIEVDIVSGQNLEPEYLAVNPRGLLPTLELDDGTRLDETIAICRYFEELHPDPPLMGTDALGKAEIESWQRHVEMDGMYPMAEAFRNAAPQFVDRAVPGTVGTAVIPELVERGRAGAARFYERLERRLADSEYIGGDAFSIADISGVCTVDFGAWVQLGIPHGCANTQRWYPQVSSRPSISA